ncbi:MAG: hypothetical protein M1823_007748, partial [Watsoniomyces obsoletus]
RQRRPDARQLLQTRRRAPGRAAQAIRACPADGVPGLGRADCWPDGAEGRQLPRRPGDQPRRDRLCRPVRRGRRHEQRRPRHPQQLQGLRREKAAATTAGRLCRTLRQAVKGPARGQQRRECASSVDETLLDVPRHLVCHGSAACHS